MKLFSPGFSNWFGAVRIATLMVMKDLPYKRWEWGDIDGKKVTNLAQACLSTKVADSPKEFTELGSKEPCCKENWL